MLTIERNNPHKKISVGVLSLAIGFASTYALLSAFIPNNFLTTATNPPKTQPIVAQNASITRDTTKHSQSDQQQSEQSPAAPAQQSGANVEQTYTAPDPAGSAAQSAVAPAALVDQSTTQPAQPVVQQPGIVDQVMCVTETAVRTAIPIL